MFKFFSVTVAVVMVLAFSLVTAEAAVADKSYIQDVYTAGPPLTQGFAPHQPVFAVTDTVYLYVAYTIVAQSGSQKLILVVTNSVGQVVIAPNVTVTTGAGSFVTNQNIPPLPAGTYFLWAVLYAPDGTSVSTHGYSFVVGQ
ncbi:MAG: hypothetical protein ACHQ0Y_12995 [Thermodesulfovibrionales bacterium]